MYDNEQKLVDRREMLRIKLKSLAEESRIIRKEEKRTFGPLRNELHNHRINVVRRAARETHIAYGLIRGLTLEQIEPGMTEEKFCFESNRFFNRKNIEAMLSRYGGSSKPALPSG